MAVIDVKEDWHGLELDAGTEQGTAPRIYTVSFDTADAPHKRRQLAYAANDGTTAVPRLYSRDPDYPWMYVKSKRVEPIGPCLFRVLVYYTTRPSRGSETEFDPLMHPLDQPPEIRWGFVVRNEPIDRDIDGNPIVNSAHESPNPPLTEDFYDLTLQISRNQIRYEPRQAHCYINTVNADMFLSFPPGTVLCTDFSGDSVRQADLLYWRVRYGFQMRIGEWLKRLIDEGFREYLGPDDNGKPKYEQIKDNEGNLITQPVMLDGNGRKLADGSPIVVREFITKRRMPFRYLGL